MRALHRLLMSATVASSLAAVPLAAQAPGTGTVLHVSPYIGYMIFGNYLTGPLGSSVSNAPSLLYGTQVGLSLAPNLSLIGNIGYTSSNIQVGLPFLGGVSVGNSSLLMYDAGLEYDFHPASSGGLALSPFLQAGVGQMRYTINESVLQTQAMNLAGNFGAGVDLALSRGVAVRVMAKDYVGKFNFQDATSLGIDGNTANNFALSAGLRLDF